jgi:hypothetical protein
MIFSKIAYKTLRPRPLFSQNKHAHHYVNNHIWSDLNHKIHWGALGLIQTQTERMGSRSNHHIADGTFT